MISLFNPMSQQETTPISYFEIWDSLRNLKRREVKG